MTATGIDVVDTTQDLMDFVGENYDRYTDALNNIYSCIENAFIELDNENPSKSESNIEFIDRINKSHPYIDAYFQDARVSCEYLIRNLTDIMQYCKEFEKAFGN